MGARMDEHTLPIHNFLRLLGDWNCDFVNDDLRFDDDENCTVLITECQPNCLNNP